MNPFNTHSFWILRFILIASSFLCLGLPSGLFSSDFRTQIFQEFLMSHASYVSCPSYTSQFGQPSSLPPCMHTYIHTYITLYYIGLLLIQCPVSVTLDCTSALYVRCGKLKLSSDGVTLVARSSNKAIVAPIVGSGGACVWRESGVR
jgi:hypothetical protein